MKMPEGFEKFKRKIEMAKKIQGFSECEEDQVLNLMKEMAEALEQAEALIEEALEEAEALIESEWGPISEDEKSGKIDRGVSKVFMALKRFRQWK